MPGHAGHSSAGNLNREVLLSREAAPARSVAALCFLPYTGHVMPLLRLARLVGQHQSVRVVAFLPAQFEQAAADYGLEFHRIEGIDQGSCGPLFAALSRKPVFYNAFSYDQDLWDYYWAALHEDVARELGSIVAGLAAMRPSLLLTDNIVFEQVYRLLATHCGATLVMNRAAGGAFRHRLRAFVRVYGLSSRPGWWQRLVEVSGDLHARVLGRWRRHLHAERRRLTESRIAVLETRVREVLGGIEPAGERAIVTSGIGPVEKRVAPIPNIAPPVPEVVLAPVIDVEVATFPSDLGAWLASQSPGHIVYVCFGTMVRPSNAVLRRVLHGLIAVGVSVLWSQPRAQRDWMSDEPLPERIRFEDFVPQASLLVSGRVDCFVTHAGQGAVQEALLGGVPMFCIPFMWDQPYMSSVVERLGCGTRRFPRTLAQRHVTDGIRELLGNPTYRQRAREIATELRTLQRAPGQTAWIDALFDGSATVP